MCSALRPRTTHPRIRPARGPAARVLLVVLLAASGCALGPDEPAPTSGYGVIEGYLLECGVPVPATIEFSLRNPVDVEARAQVRPDSTGWYRVELPVGSYRVSLRSDAVEPWLQGNHSEADTVQLGRAVRRRDFLRGRARIEVTLPAWFDGTTATLVLNRPEASADQRADVVDGVAAFDLRLVPIHGYVMRLDPSGDLPAFMLPGTFLVANADSLRIGSVPATYAADLRDRFVRVEGRVTGSWQQGGLSMDVVAVSPSGSSRGLARCDADGTFRLDLIAPDLVRIASRYGSMYRWFGGTATGAPTLYELAPGQTITGLEMSEGGLRLDFEGPGLLADALGSVLLVHPDGTRQNLDLSYHRNPVLLVNLAAGDYRLQIVGGCALDPWLPQWYDGAVDEADALPLTVVEGALTDATIRHQAGGVLRGVFAGEPAVVNAGRRIYLFDAAGTPVCGNGSWFTGSAFEWPGLPDGVYVLGMVISSTSWWYPGTQALDQAERLTIVDGAVVSDLVWQLPPSEVVIIR